MPAYSRTTDAETGRFRQIPFGTGRIFPPAVSRLLDGGQLHLRNRALPDEKIRLRRRRVVNVNRP